MCVEWVGELELDAVDWIWSFFFYLVVFLICFVMLHDGRDEMIKVSQLWNP